MAATRHEICANNLYNKEVIQRPILTINQQGNHSKPLNAFLFTDLWKTHYNETKAFIHRRPRHYKKNNKVKGQSRRIPIYH